MVAPMVTKRLLADALCHPAAAGTGVLRCVPHLRKPGIAVIGRPRSIAGAALSHSISKPLCITLGCIFELPDSLLVPLLGYIIYNPCMGRTHPVVLRDDWVCQCFHDAGALVSLHVVRTCGSGLVRVRLGYSTAGDRISCGVSLSPF